MRNLLFAAFALTAFSIPVQAITVSTPSNGATVSSPFVVTASTKTCASLPAVSMGYSIDSGTAIIEPTSFSALVTATPGAHVLHVKCWGQKVNDQVLLNITVLAATTTDISVATPFSGASVTSPFTLTASVKTCGSVPAVSMGYSIDDAKAIIEPTAFSASVTAPAGAHVLHVKCWGQQTSDQRLININVGAAAQASTPWFSVPAGTYSTKQTVSMASATAGSTIYFTTDGSAPSTSSYRYSGPITIAGTMTVQAIAMAPSYNNSGLARASYVISASPKGPSIPSYAIVEKEIQQLPNWRIKHDSATSGTSTGSLTLVSDPTLSGQTGKFYTTFTNAGGELYSVSYGNDTDAKNFVYDAHVWISAGSVVSNLEMDNNQVMRNGDTVIYAFQCSGYTNTWEYTENAGTTTAPVAKWLRSTAPCNPSNWTRNTWHHIQISYSRDDSGNVTYHSVWFDGVESPINRTVNSAFSLGWALGAMVANFQVDGLGTSGSSTLYLDNFTISRW